MATLTTITTGMEKGPEAIDANFKALNITDSGWITTGFTLLNGCTTVSSDQQAYRTLSFNTFKLVFVDFSINIPATTYGTTTSVLQFPAGVTNKSMALSFLTVVGANHLASWQLGNDVLAVTSRDAWTTQQTAIIRGAFTVEV